MKMAEYPRLGETVFRQTLSNGLEVVTVHKPFHAKSYAFLAVRYGGMDLRFQTEGRWRETPAGIAHYLEHKMFDMASENVMQSFARNGASDNAFTSNAMTAYYFTSTAHFYENLRILLRFVSTPYFTQESVDKEQGIIAQEIQETEDDPDWRVYANLMERLYQDSPARVPVVGSLESIRQITPQTLYDCHKAFYTPSNMILVCVGNVDQARVAEEAEAILPREGGPAVIRDYGREDAAGPAGSEVSQAMEVSMPMFLAGYKCQAVDEGEGTLRQSIVGDLACDAPCIPASTRRALSTAAWGAISTCCRAPTMSMWAATPKTPGGCLRRSPGRPGSWGRRASARTSTARSAGPPTAGCSAVSTLLRTLPSASRKPISGASTTSASRKSLMPSERRTWRRFCGKILRRRNRRCP